MSPIQNNAGNITPLILENQLIYFTSHYISKFLGAPLGTRIIWIFIRNFLEKCLSQEDISEKRKLSENGNAYANLIKQLLLKYEDRSLIIAADFNLNPHLIDEWETRAS